jgi:SAM-dependent methyltransferase
VSRTRRDYQAHWGYRAIDAGRYEQRRYGSWLRRLNLRALERAIGRALAGVPPAARVLDAPCGTGILQPTLRARRYRAIGMDVSRAMLAAAGHSPDAPPLVAGDLHAAPFRAGSFDAVLCVRFLMLLPPAERPAVLRDLAGLTRGPLVVTICHPYTLKSVTRALRRRLGWRIKPRERLDRATLAREVAEAGLELRRVIRVMPLLSEVWVAVLARARVDAPPIAPAERRTPPP